jgi:hypothetical protein
VHLSFTQHSQWRKRKSRRNGNPLSEPYATSLEAIHSQNSPFPNITSPSLPFAPSPQTVSSATRPSASSQTTSLPLLQYFHVPLYTPSANLRSLIHLPSYPANPRSCTPAHLLLAMLTKTPNPISLPHAPPDPALMQGMTKRFLQGGARPGELRTTIISGCFSSWGLGARPPLGTS